MTPNSLTAYSFALTNEQRTNERVSGETRVSGDCVIQIEVEEGNGTILVTTSYCATEDKETERKNTINQSINRTIYQSQTQGLMSVQNTETTQSKPLTL